MSVRDDRPTRSGIDELGYLSPVDGARNSARILSGSRAISAMLNNEAGATGNNASAAFVQGTRKLKLNIVLSLLER